MEETNENIQYVQLHDYNNDSHEGASSHKELQDIDFTPKTKLRKAVEYTARGISDFMRAMDDIFGYYSSIATLGFVILMAPFLVIAGLLSIAYFIVKQRKINLNNALYSGKKNLNAIAEQIITEEHYKEWKTLINLSGEKKLADNFEDYIRKHDAEEIHNELKKCIADIEEKLNSYEGPRQQIELIKKQLAILSDFLPNKQLPAPAFNSRFDYVKYYIKRAWGWLVDNYKKILTGVTIAATFCTLGVIIFGSALLTMFPVNIIVALVIVSAVAVGNWAYKTYFKKKFQEMMGTYQNAKNALTDKKEQADLLIRAKQINYQLEHQIKKLATQEKKKDDNNNNNFQMKVEDFDLEKTDENDEDESFELVEVQHLREKPSRLRYIANFILPSLLALNAGYGIGATLLQLTIISGLSAPILPFILVGVIFGAIYVVHRIYQSAKENFAEKAQIENLNTNIIDKKKIELYESRYALATNKNMIDNKKGEAICVKQYIAEHTADKIADDLITVYATNNTALKRYKEVIASQISTLHSRALKEKLLKAFELNPLAVLETEEKDESKLSKIKTLMARYIKPFAQGAGFGLSVAASLIIFLVGASTFVSISWSISILVIGACVGLAICLLNKIVNTYRKKFEGTIHDTEHAIEDKDQLMEMLVASYEVEKITGPAKVEVSTDNQSKHENAFVKQRSQSFASLAELTANKRKELDKKFERFSNNTGPAEGASLERNSF